MTDSIPERMPEHMAETMPDRMPENMSVQMPQRMPDRMSEQMPDRMPEQNVRQNARIECQKIIPYIFPDDMSETMTNKCQGGDHSVSDRQNGR